MAFAERLEVSAPYPLNCILLGEEPLAQRCGDYLIERGHRIAALVTRSPELKSWAAKHGIIILNYPSYRDWASSNNYDSLFSITHPALIPAKLIEKAVRGAVNYHDGPLPRYAGMNGSSWALMNGERQHAIVWHKLTSGLDAGDILERRSTEIEERETSLSLNIKNSALAFESFHDVVERLESGNLCGVAQRTDIERSEFSRHDRPPNLAIIDWNDSAVKIHAMIRSCYFGHFPNAFGAPKIVHNGKCLVVLESDYRDVTSDHPPGKVVAIHDAEIVIQCATGQLALKRFSLPAGMPTGSGILGAKGASALLQLDSNTSLVSEQSRLDNKLVARQEAGYIRDLLAYEVPELPLKIVSDLAFVRPLHLPRALLDPSVEARCSGFALFLIALSNLLRQDTMTFALATPQFRQPALTNVISPTVPLNVTIMAKSSFFDFVKALDQRVTEAEHGTSFLLDLIDRQPALRARPGLCTGQISTVAVLVNGADLPAGARLGITLDREGGSLVSDGSVAACDIDQLVARVVAIANQIASSPELSITKLCCLTQQEFTEQVFGWNDTAREYPKHLRIFDMFESQVDERPDDVALICEGATMSFLELEQSANQLAHVLQEEGARPGTYVALVVERSFNLVIALLGIAKSGAAYVPIDTIYPPERAEFMLQDAQCLLTVTTQNLVERCGGDTKTLIIDGERVRRAATRRVRSSSQSEDVCYAIYTSGSTGKPKGVVLTHRAVVNTLDWVNRNFEVTPQDRLLFVTSPSFDLSVYDVFGALGAGAQVEVATSRILDEPEFLVKHVIESGITIWDSAPPALARLAPFFPEQAKTSKLRLVMLSGDWIPVTLPPHLKRTFPNVSVRSLGGATEAAIWSNFYPVTEVLSEWTSIPYGYPIQNARYYILDHHLRAVPPQIAGDLYIGGVCLASGYLNRPELTHERFIADPFIPGELIYKTGDLAKYWDDGTMEFLGRSDFQIKIRGYRVEIGEIEAALVAEPNIREALCVARVDGSGQKALTAYLLTNGDQPVDVEALKRNLAERLPDYMVPSFIMPLAAFPITSNGKVDRASLPSPDSVAATATYIAPRTDAEKSLTKIWETVFGRQQIGIDDNFFELGGHSLMAVALATEVKKRLAVDFPLSQVLGSPTVRAQAAIFDEPAPNSAIELSAETKHETINVLRSGGSQSFFFIYDGEGETLLYLNLARRLPPKFTVYGILPDRKPGVPLAHLSIEAMAKSTLLKLKSVQTKGPYFLGGLCAGGVIAFETAHQLEADGDAVAIVVLLEAFEPKATPRRGVITQKRLDRFRSVFKGSDGVNHSKNESPRQTSTGPNRWKSAAGKIYHAASYEILSRLTELSVKMRIRLLARILDSDGAWPAWAPSLGIRDIYIHARSKFNAHPVQSLEVVVVRATQAVAGVANDDPVKTLYVESDFGWSKFSNNPLHLMDVEGGHSSMLQEPFVDDLARQLAPTLDRVSQ